MFSRRSFFRSFCLSVAAGVTLVAINMKAPAAAQGSAAFIRSTGQEAINSLTAQNMTDQERQERFRQILKRTFAVGVIARFTLGRYWRVATKAQRAEYSKLFEDFLVRAYAERFKGYSGEGFEVGQMRQINDREQLVQSEVVLADGRRIPVHWRVRHTAGYRVVDVLVEGVSMAITQRDEFAAIINRNGGKVDGLLAALREKTVRK